MSKLNIKLTSQEGVTLHTEGTYCEKSIAVIPHLESITVTPTTEVQNITPSEGYAGIGSVRVEAGGETRPYFDGTVVIEKAESVLGLRRFKDLLAAGSIKPIGDALLSSETQYFDFSAQGVLGEEKYVIKNIGIVCFNNSGVPTIAGLEYIGDIYEGDELTTENHTQTVYSLFSQNETFWVQPMLQTVEIIEEPTDITLKAWLLANTEGVSV